MNLGLKLGLSSQNNNYIQMWSGKPDVNRAKHYQKL